MPRLLKRTEDRLRELVLSRSRPGADVEGIDRRIWDLYGERAAVMFTDLSGFSRQVEAFGILHFLALIYEQEELLGPVIEEHCGTLIKVEADSMLVLFRRAESAIACAVAMQRRLEDVNASRAPEDKMLLCVGIGYGDVLRIGDTDVYGREVNAASKLGEDTARAREILVTGAARQAAGDVPYIFEKIDVEAGGSSENYKLQF